VGTRASRSEQTNHRSGGACEPESGNVALMRGTDDGASNRGHHCALTRTEISIHRWGRTRQPARAAADQERRRSSCRKAGQWRPFPFVNFSRFRRVQRRRELVVACTSAVVRAHPSSVSPATDGYEPGHNLHASSSVLEQPSDGDPTPDKERLPARRWRAWEAAETTMPPPASLRRLFFLCICSAISASVAMPCTQARASTKKLGYMHTYAGELLCRILLPCTAYVLLAATGNAILPSRTSRNGTQ
jgi:hypothetical protein